MTKLNGLTIDSFRNHWVKDLGLDLNIKCVVGFSGGADSTALVHLLATLRFDFVAAYLHHGQRAEADAELAHCAQFCEDYKVQFVSGKADIPAIAKAGKIGIEEAGRLARYRFFESVKKQFDLPFILTAHTQSDQVETVLFQITRGSGLKGLTGIPEMTNELIRPLLLFSRENTEAYCQERGLNYTHDQTNDDLHFSRVFLRKEVIPRLLMINPGMPEAITRMTRLLAQEEKFLNALAVNYLTGCEVKLNRELNFISSDCEIAFDRLKLAALEKPMLSRGIRLISERLGAKPDYLQVNSLLKAISSSERRSFTLDGGEVTILISAEKVHFYRAEPKLIFRESIPSLGTLDFPELGWKLDVSQSKPETARETMRASLKAIIDYKKVKWPIFTRNFSAGDKIQPLGFTHERKISSLMSEYGLTRIAKQRIPILCDVLGPIWVPGICLSHRISWLTETLADNMENKVSTSLPIKLEFTPVQ